MPYADPELQRAFQREWRARRRATYTDGVACETCGSDHDIQWHHRDPATKLSHRIWSWSIPRIEAELEKCVPLCGTCHVEHHRGDSMTPIPHGTHSGYSHHGCRCADCTAAHATYCRARRIAGAGLEPATSGL